MNITAGTRLRRYEIRSKLGEGGMGEVYLAHDSGLGRKVALKILPAGLASNRERMDRFVREAKSAASLNHPHIAHVYEIGEDQGVHFIAMEFIEGETLRQKIYGKKISLTGLLKYLRQAAEGLAKAHAAGIVHRDLKPDNIMITHDGYAKILDFGLAKLVEGQRAAGFGDSSSEIATAVMPQHSLPGTVLGTVGYMSPEQAQGRVNEIDQRSDIFSFGCILFEAATGHKPFQGVDALDSLHKIVHAATPQIREFNATAPDDLQRIIRRCLAKEPDRRFQSIKDVAIELEDIRAELKGAAGLEPTSAPNRDPATSGIEITQLDEPRFSAVNTSVAPSHSTSSAEYIVTQIGRHKKGFVFALAAVAVVLIGGSYLLYRFANRTALPPVPGRMTIKPLVNGINGGSASISPDGKYVVYVVVKDGSASLNYRQVSSGSYVEIAALGKNVEIGPTTISADSDSVYYELKSRDYPKSALFRVPIIGGLPPRKILDFVSSAISFAPDGKRFVFRRQDDKTGESGIYIGSIDGGEPYLLARRTGMEYFTGSPAWSPDGKVIVAPAGTETGGTQTSLVEIPAAGGADRAFVKFKWHGDGVHRPLWLSDGSGLVVNASERGNPTQIWQVSYPQGDVTRITTDSNYYGNVSFGVTRDASTIVTIISQFTSQIWLTNAGDEESRARRVTDGKTDGDITILPDGRFIYQALNGENQDIWIMNGDGSGQRQLLSSTDPKAGLKATPDGRFLLYVVSKPGEQSQISRLNIATGEDKPLTFAGASDSSPFSSPDSQTVYFSSWRTGSYRLWKVSIDGGDPAQVTDLPFNAGYFLPGGKLIAGDYLDEQVTPRRFRSAFYSIADDRIVKTFDFPLGVGAKHVLDEHTIAYRKSEAGVDSIWIQPIDGGPAKQLTRFSTLSIFGFVTSPDNKHLAIVRGTDSGDIVLIKNFR